MLHKIKNIIKPYMPANTVEHRSKAVIYREAEHINGFRNENYRVFLAGPYFNLDLWYEIEWQKRYLNKLQMHHKKPHLFHAQHHAGEIDEHRKRHYQEHVVESIPFHKKILEDHRKRLSAILEIMPEKTYKKIVKISMKHHGTPEYFVYDKVNSQFFFVAEHIGTETRKWISLVRDKYHLANVVAVN